MNEIVIEAYRPGCIAGMIGLHMQYYAPEWGFGAAFEAKLAAESGAFMSEFVVKRDLVLSAWLGEILVASLFIDGSQRDGVGNHLRWFVVSNDVRGTGLGRQLMGRAMEFCDASGHSLTWLTTFAGLDAAAALYRKSGFQLVDEVAEDQWQGGVREQRFERKRGS